tara:strand:+ start:56136 stop:56519 length:384 start_codon:yes stop_codon:yes gene_type:complete
MRKLDIYIKGVKIEKLILNEYIVKYKVAFEINDEVKTITMENSIGNSEEIVKKLIDSIREREKVIIEGDDILSSIVLLNINDQEETEKKLINFFSKFNDGVRALKSRTSSEDYMGAYHKIMGEGLKI